MPAFISYFFLWSIYYSIPFSWLINELFMFHFVCNLHFASNVILSEFSLGPTLSNAFWMIVLMDILLECFLRLSSGTSPCHPFFYSFMISGHITYSANNEFHLILRINFIPIFPNITFLRSAALAVITSCALQQPGGGHTGGRQPWCLATSDLSWSTPVGWDIVRGSRNQHKL